MKTKKETTTNKKNQEKTEISFLAALFFAFNLFFFAPMDFYYSNAEQITIGMKYLLTALLIPTIIAFILLFLLFRLTREKQHTFFTSLFMGLGLAMYIQGNYLNSGMGTFDGHEYKASSLKICINLIVWAAVIIVPFLIAKFNKKFFPKFIKFLSFFIVTIEIVTIVILRIKLHIADTAFFFEKANMQSNNAKIMSTQDQFLYSNDENLIVIIPDEYDSRCFDNSLKTDNDFIDSFDGFIYYENTLGMYNMTDLAVPYLLTGKNPSHSYDYSDTSFFDAVSKNMKTDIYGESQLIPPEICEKYADNYINRTISASDFFNVGKIFYKVTLFKYLPEAFKKNFFVYSSDINNAFSSVQCYFFDNLAFYNHLQSDLEFTDEKCFKLFYMHGLHNPRNINADLERVENWSITADEQAVAVNKILLKYFDILKSNGVYENSTIVIMADHGLRESENGMYPLLMIKKAGSSGTPMEISSVPISHKDVFPTLMFLAGEPNGEETVYDIPEDIPRDRYFASLDLTVSETQKPHELSDAVK